MLRLKSEQTAIRGLAGDFSPVLLVRDLLRYAISAVVSLARRLDRYDLAFLALLLVLCGTVWKVVHSTPGVLGVDIGNYLLTMRQAFGDDPTGLGLLRPPLIALPLKLFSSVMPLVTATKALAVLAWLAPGFPAYRLARMLSGDGRVACVVSVFGGLGYVLSSMFATMLVFGWISFLGILFIPIIAMLVIKGVQADNKRWAVSLAIALSLLLATHQLTAVLVVLWMGLFTLGVIVLRNRKAAIFMLKSGILSGALSIWMVPIYLSLRAGTDQRFTSFGFQGIAAVWSGLAWFYRQPGLWFWLTAILVAVLGVVAIARHSQNSNRSVNALLMGLMLAVPLLLNSASSSIGQRALYYSYLPIWVLASVCVGIAIQQFLDMSPWVRRHGLLLPGIVLGAAASFVLIDFHRGFQDQLGNAMRFYNMVEARHLEAAEHVSEHTPPESRFIAFPFGLGWWIEGASGRDAYEIGRFGNKVQNRQSEIAEHVLVGNYSISNGAFLVGDSYPDPLPGTPQLWLTMPGGERAPFAYLDDGLAAVKVLEHGIAERRYTLRQMARELSVARSDDSIGLVKRFTAGGVSATQTTRLEAGRYGWEVTYDVDSREQPVVELSLPVHFENLRQITPSEEGGGYIAVHRVREHNGQSYDVFTRLGFASSGAAVSSVLGPVSNLRGAPYDRPVLITVIPEAQPFSFTISAEVTSIRSVNRGGVEISMGSMMFTEVEHADALSLLTDNQVTHLAMDHRPFHRLGMLSASTLRRLKDAPGFELSYMNDDVAIYEVHLDKLLQNEAVARVARVPSPLHRADMGILEGSASWTGLRASNIRRVTSMSEDVEEVVSADVQMEAGKWSGIIFTPAEPLDWSGMQWVSARIRWESLQGLQTLSLALEDEAGKRWAWQVSGRDAPAIAGGWQAWDFRREAAARKDSGFDFGRIVRVHISALGANNLTATANRVEVASIAGLFEADAGYSREPSQATAPLSGGGRR